MRLCALVFASLICAGAAVASTARPGSLPTGQTATPTAASGAIFQSLNPDLPGLPGFVAGQASAMALSPDGRTLLILTSGYNRNSGPDGKIVPGFSMEYVFVYDVSEPAPRKVQVLQIANTFLGLAWAPSGQRFYVSGGVDDVVLEYGSGSAGFEPGRRFVLGHKTGLGILAKPETAGLAISPDGRRLLAANYQNDSVSLIDLEAGKVVAEQDLRPGVINPGVGPRPGGTFPKALIWTSNTQAMVAVQRDRELVALKIGEGAISVGARLKLRGQPVALAVNRAGSRLFAALDNSDGLAVVDPRDQRLLEAISTAAPRAILPNAGRLGGAGSNAIALTPDEQTALVSNGGQNAVAVVRLDDLATGNSVVVKRAPGNHGMDDGEDDAPRHAGSQVIGLIPTGWYPTAVVASKDGEHLYIVNAKSDPGPNPKACRNTYNTKGKGDCPGANQYVWQLEKAGFLTLPTPAPSELGRLTRQVAANNGYIERTGEARDRAMMAFLRAHIRHVVYVVKENRTYDQILGDLEVGNGDPKLALLGSALTPNHHALARRFVTLDNFLDSGESSNTGWNWTTAARTTDFTEREAPVNYSARGLQYDQEGGNRNVNVGFKTAAERVAANPATPADPNLLSGDADVAAPDGANADAGHGYLWDGALKAGLTIRNWGFYGDLSRYYEEGGGGLIPLERDPYAKKLQVFFTTKPALRPYTDPYYRGFDQAFPDYWRFKEWEREFAGFEAVGRAPNLMLIRLPHDHFGSFDKGIDGVNTVETEIADNDYALGLMVQKIARSRFAKNTLVFVIEDDAQDGADHVSAHRSIALITGPYVKQHAVVSTRYTTVNFLRTIEDVLGIKPLNLNDAMARPMTDVFNRAAPNWTFAAEPADVLATTGLPIPRSQRAKLRRLGALRTAAYWSKAMAGQDFRTEDKLDTAAFNRALRLGLAPEIRTQPGSERLTPATRSMVQKGNDASNVSQNSSK